MIGRFGQIGMCHELTQSRDMRRIGLGGLLGLAGYLWDGGNEAQSLVGSGLVVVALIINGAPIVWGAAKGLAQRRVNVDELVSLALIASVLLGEYFTAVVVSLVMVLGSLIEELTAGAARKAITSLMSIAPETANLLVDGQVEVIPIREVKVGDVLVVRPGDRIPVDAVVLKGITAVDESSMTGEPIPKEKIAGDEVYAGTLNQNGVIEIEAKLIGEYSTLGKIINLVSAAEDYKPQAISLIDRYATWFTPTILLCAGVAWWLTGDAGRAVTVLIVGCPCALILAAPTAIVAAVGRAAGSGILIKGGRFLEEAGRADVVLFDKTGTLTEGQPRIRAIVTADEEDETKVLACAASVEQNSAHPFAKAALKAAHYAKVTLSAVEDMVTEVGLGVRACVNGKIVEVGSAYIGGGSMNLPVALRERVEDFRENGETPLVICEDSQPLGVISVSDPVRASAKKTVHSLRSLGVERIGMLSGDHAKSVNLVAGEIGLTDAWPEQTLQGKLEIIRDFQTHGKTVMFVGDGINDAPALATANVGVAMGAAGTDVTLETADVALMNDDISCIPFLIVLGKRTLKIIKWNIALGLFFNAVAVVAGGGGLISPVMGAIVHNIGSVLVVMSSASIAFTSVDA